MHEFRGAVFDLDGVLVDTALYHYLAWKDLAAELRIPFSPSDNERLKGVSRMESLSIILSLAVPGSPADRQYSEEEKEILADRKNRIYVEKIAAAENLCPLPGVLETLRRIREIGVRTAIGSSSRNAPLIMERLGIGNCFDAIVDGRHISRTKPHPEVFLAAAGKLSLEPGDCVVFEDSAAGIAAAKSAGMYSVGIGKRENLLRADRIMPFLDPDQIFPLFS